jgi:hypothetical protein
MSSRKLRSRSQSVDRAGSVQGTMDEDSPTDFNQERRIMISESIDSEVSASNTNLENTNQENHTTNPNYNEQSSSISWDQLQEFLNNVMKGIKAESAKQTAAQEESRKQRAEEFKRQIAVLQEGSEKQTHMLSAKLTSVVESLKSEIKEENNRLPSSLTAKFEAAHHKIREDFEVKLNSEIITVSAKTDNVQKDNESEISKLSSILTKFMSM